MTSPGRYAASDGSFAKSAGGAAARGGVLIGIAVLIGFFLLWQGFDGGDADADTATGDTPATVPGDEADPAVTVPGDETDPAVTVPTTTTDTVVVDDPSSVSVVILNGTGESGLASERGEALGAVGYTWTAANAAGVPVDLSKVYYIDGFRDEANAVAEALAGGAGLVELAPPDPTTLATESGAEKVAAADVIVVLGADGALS
jgi:hypothetical protein